MAKARKSTESGNLVKISTYARKKNISISYVYKLIGEEKLDNIGIDGMTFVVMNKLPDIPEEILLELESLAAKANLPLKHFIEAVLTKLVDDEKKKKKPNP